MPKPSGTSGAPSIIGSDIKINGNLTTPGEIQLDGVIDGDISCGALTMGEHGQVSGTISADSVVIRGKVEGTIRARTVRLEKTSKVTGDINHETVSVEAGAYVEGKFVHVDGAAGGAKVAQSQSAPNAETPAAKQSPNQASTADAGNGSSGRRESLLGS